MDNNDKPKGLGAITQALVALRYGPAAAQDWKRKRRKALARKRDQHIKNVAARAALYSEYDGEISHTRLSDWHTRLNALSQGTL
jgi:hypothetical protein